MLRLSKNHKAALFGLGLLLYCGLFCPACICAELPTVQLEANGHHIEAEVAATVTSRALGLMYRNDLPANHGMLFITPEVRPHCMVMKNTVLPLSAAFLGGDGTIANIVDMEPGSTERYCATKPVLYVLEMNRGWFREKGVGAGARVTGLEKAPEGE